MSDNTYRVIEIVGTSTTGVDDAITAAVSRASHTLEHLDWFEMTSVRGHIENGRIGHFQVQLKVGFKIDS